MGTKIPSFSFFVPIMVSGSLMNSKRYQTLSILVTVLLIVAFGIYLTFVLLKGFSGGFEASDGAWLAVYVVLFGGIMCGLWFVDTGMMARVAVLAFLAFFSLYHGVTCYSTYLYQIELTDGLNKATNVVLLLAGIIDLAVFLAVGLSYILPQMKKLYRLIAEMVLLVSALLYVVGGILYFVQGFTVLGLSALFNALVTVAFILELEALDLLPSLRAPSAS